MAFAPELIGKTITSGVRPHARIGTPAVLVFVWLTTALAAAAYAGAYAALGGLVIAFGFSVKLLADVDFGVDVRPVWLRVSMRELDLGDGARRTRVALATVASVSAGSIARDAIVVRTASATYRVAPVGAHADVLARHIEVRAAIARRGVRDPLMAAALEALALTGAEAVLFRRGRFVRALALDEAVGIAPGGRRRVFARRAPDPVAAGPYRSASTRAPIEVVAA